MLIQDINAFTPKQVKQEMQNAKDEGRNYFIFRHKTKTGELKTVEVFSHPYSFKDNRTLLLSMVNDITPQRLSDDELWHYEKRLEEQVKIETNKQEKLFGTTIVLLLLLIAVLSYFLYRLSRLQKSYKDANMQYENLFDASSSIAMIATDTQGTITAFNKAAQKMLGYRASEVINKHTPQIFHEPDELERQDSFRAFLETFTASGPQKETFTYISKDKTPKQVALEITAITDSQGKKSGYLGIARDVTEKLRAQQKLKENETKLQKLNEALHQEVEAQVKQIRQKISSCKNRQNSRLWEI